jgi:GxxExxY protein
VTDLDSITEPIIGGAIAVHRELGPGLLESTYEACLDAYLTREGLEVERQVTMPLVFMGQQLDYAYRIDLLVEGQVVVELKTVAQLHPVHFAQMMTYLKLSTCQVGLLINFNVTVLKYGIRRVVHAYREPSAASHPSAPSTIDPVGVAGRPTQSATPLQDAIHFARPSPAPPTPRGSPKPFP